MRFTGKIVVGIVSFMVCTAGATVFANELNSGNIAGSPYNCSIEASSCLLNGKGISSIAPDTFSGYTNLTSLDLGDNSLTGIQVGEFSGLSNLQTLVLARNQITTIDSGAFAGLDNLQTLQIYTNQLTGIHVGEFAGLGGLQTLGLEDCQIATIESGAFAPMSGLITMHFRDNQLTGIQVGMFAGLDNLQELTVRRNHIATIENGAFAGLSDVTQFDISNNELTSLSHGEFSGLTGLLALHLSYNNISSIETGAFAGLDNLDQLELYHNRITSLEAGVFAGLDTVTYLDIGTNQITTTNNIHLTGLVNLQTFYIYANQINSISSGLFMGMSGINEIDLGQNQFTSTKDIRLGGMSGLLYLSIYNNFLSSIESGAFAGLSNLTYIDLSYNQIGTIEKYDFTGLTNLETLYLNDNAITHIEDDAFTRGDNFGNFTIYQNCSDLGEEEIPYGVEDSTQTLENTNCGWTSTDASTFGENLDLGGYGQDEGEPWVGYRAISLNGVGSTGEFTQRVRMISTDRNGYSEFPYYEKEVQVEYESGTTVTNASGAIYTGLIYGGQLYATGPVEGLSGLVSIARFGALTQEIDFSTPVTVRIPVVGKSSGDVVNIYSSEAETIYSEHPDWRYEGTGQVVNYNDGLYVIFTTNHASWRGLITPPTVVDTTPPPTPRPSFGGGGGATPGPDSIIVSTPTATPVTNAATGSTNTTTTEPNIKGCDTLGSEDTKSYCFARLIGATTAPTLFKADYTRNSTREEVAKMLVNYAIHILHLIPDTSKQCNYGDASTSSEEMQGYITEACQLGLMGVNNHGTASQIFRPGDTITRGEYMTVLSRMLYGNNYDVTDSEKDTVPFYQHHMDHLLQEKIFTQKNPEDALQRFMIFYTLYRLGAK